MIFCRNFTLTPTFIVILLSIRVTFQDICFDNSFNSLVPVIILKAFSFKFLALFGAHILLDRSVRVLQLPVHLSQLTANVQ